MTSQLALDDLVAWCSIPAEGLAGHPQAKVPLRVLDQPADVHHWAAGEMLAEVRRNNAAGQPTRWILPCGPTKQYALFIEAVNREGLSLHDVHVFHMDDYLTWNARHLPLDHPMSYEGWMRRNFYAPVNPDLAIPEAQRHFPRVHDLDGISRAIEAAGGVDTLYGGIGYRGHIAYQEPPYSPWYSVSMDEFRCGGTRILHLNEDTLIAASQRNLGGLAHYVPPMAITIGMKDMLAARRIRLFSETGAWKRTVIRVLLFGPQTLEYPVTLVQDHPDVLVVIDKETARAPLDGVLV